VCKGELTKLGREVAMTDRPYPSFLMYKDENGEYRWRYQASNAKVIAEAVKVIRRRLTAGMASN
jgi:hypothetical protein